MKTILKLLGGIQSNYCFGTTGDRSPYKLAVDTSSSQLHHWLVLCTHYGSNANANTATAHYSTANFL